MTITGTNTIQYLQTLIYSNCQLGPQSLAIIKLLIPNLVELMFNHLTWVKDPLKPAEKLVDVLTEVMK